MSFSSQNHLVNIFSVSKKYFVWIWTYAALGILITSCRTKAEDTYSKSLTDSNGLVPYEDGFFLAECQQGYQHIVSINEVQQDQVCDVDIKSSFVKVIQKIDSQYSVTCSNENVIEVDQSIIESDGVCQIQIEGFSHNWTKEDFVNLFSPGESKVKLSLSSSWNSYIKSKKCHKVTGCNQWKLDTNQWPNITYANSERIWGQELERSVFNRETAPVSIEWPNDRRFDFEIRLVGRKLKFQLYSTLELKGYPGRVFLNGSWNDHSQKLSFGGVGVASEIQWFNEKKSCYRSGNNLLCWIGNSLSNGMITMSGEERLRSEDNIYKADVIFSDNQLIIEVKNVPNPRATEWQEYVWILIADIER